MSSCDCLIFINHSFLRGIEPVHLSDIDYQGTYLKELDSWSVAHSESLVAAYSLKGILAYHRRPAHFFMILQLALSIFLGLCQAFPMIILSQLREVIILTFPICFLL